MQTVQKPIKCDQLMSQVSQESTGGTGLQSVGIFDS
jgi:hypothetical protein